MSRDRLHGDLICTEDGYKTCDLYLAAFFATAGCPIKSTTRDAKKVFFLFENNELIEKLKSDYFLRQAKVDALSYADNIKSLKSLCASIIGSRDSHR
ncbi:MAG: hypothetical protein GF334_13240 [Candidatus Altiarchaeales archaeon]|nr:hypothetical protein [Candidatus Altiarchaeales archaeon]